MSLDVSWQVKLTFHATPTIPRFKLVGTFFKIYINVILLAFKCDLEQLVTRVDLTCRSLIVILSWMMMQDTCSLRCLCLQGRRKLLHRVSESVLCISFSLFLVIHVSS